MAFALTMLAAAFLLLGVSLGVIIERELARRRKSRVIRADVAAFIHRVGTVALPQR